ncbi:MAG: histidinol dehydrogenase [Prevotellaceae bacterium]|nr:histidinol dehydrogenase [Prevotellaceae bacterium]
MNIIKYPAPSDWASIVARPHIDMTHLNDTVSKVIDEIRQGGDAAVKKYEKEFDHVELDSLLVSKDEMRAAQKHIPAGLWDAMQLAHENIRKFHAAQQFNEIKVETAPGVVCWQKAIPIERVGLYIPGGTAPLFSTVLMLATPAKIAGCKHIIMCTPPDRTGHVNPAILAAASIAGIDHVYKAGGVQAIAAMAYGTESVPKVSKIFGPGNQYVMAAKQRVSLDSVAIDMPAGPSEVCVIADAQSNPRYVAADLLSQAEHGMDSQVLLISTSEQTIDAVEQEIGRQLDVLPRKDIAAKALENSKIVLVHNGDEAMALSNAYAPEHLIIDTADYAELAEKVVNAGSVFLGNYACESAGDYASGTNHTLPTHGYADAYSGVNLDSFMRKVTFQHLDREGVRSIGRAVETMAENEQLLAHKNAMTLRLSDIEKSNT